MFPLALASALPAAARRPRVAAVITEYRRNSHADVIVTRLLEGYEYYGERRAPAVEVVSMYTDQVPANDMSRDMAARHRVRIFPTVREALAAGGDRMAVDGVVLIGEHGNYPDNEKGQKLYPRYELFRQIVEGFEASRRVAPVFTDKHLSTDWEKAKWMYDRSRALKFPLMAGSSLPVAWRRPPMELDLGSEITHAVVAAHGPKESYGFHALETLQCMMERRRGGETGIASVQCLDGDEVWRWTGANEWAGKLLEAALERSETRRPGTAAANAKRPSVFLVEYRTGAAAAVYLLNGHVNDFTFAARIRGRPEPAATLVWLQGGRPHSHFSGLTFHIEKLILSRREPYPVERTLLTTGALAALMDSAYRGGVRLQTAYLAVSYRAVKESLYNRGAVPALEAAS